LSKNKVPSSLQDEGAAASFSREHHGKLSARFLMGLTEMKLYLQNNKIG